MSETEAVSENTEIKNSDHTTNKESIKKSRLAIIDSDDDEDIDTPKTNIFSLKSTEISHKTSRKTVIEDSDEEQESVNKSHKNIKKSIISDSDDETSENINGNEDAEAKHDENNASENSENEINDTNVTNTAKKKIKRVKRFQDSDDEGVITPLNKSFDHMVNPTSEQNLAIEKPNNIEQSSGIHVRRINQSGFRFNNFKMF